MTQARALACIEPELPITPLECLDDLLDKTLVVQRRLQQGTLPCLERDVSALPWGLVVHRIHLLASRLMSDIFDRNLSPSSTEDPDDGYRLLRRTIAFPFHKCRFPG
jgi:hypothetical protein